MKHEIEIPDLPEGWEPVAYRYGYKGETGFDKELFTIDMEKSDYPLIIVRKKQPLRIVLEESDIDNYDIVYRKNVGTTTYWKIVEDNKCAE